MTTLSAVLLIAAGVVGAFFNEKAAWVLVGVTGLLAFLHVV